MICQDVRTGLVALMLVLAGPALAGPVDKAKDAVDPDCTVAKAARGAATKAVVGVRGNRCDVDRPGPRTPPPPATRRAGAGRGPPPRPLPAWRLGQAAARARTGEDGRAAAPRPGAPSARRRQARRRSAPRRRDRAGTGAPRAGRSPDPRWRSTRAARPRRSRPGSPRADRPGAPAPEAAPCAAADRRTARRVRSENRRSGTSHRRRCRTASRSAPSSLRSWPSPLS
jgi:hypothetical protein